ncbi:MAG: hypothetical protein BWY11_02073 [Firmicutes bacterium ADurb.Bin182]|nr:MAG: hypothetical protein BWY11_02073 [Firmicutes bacterium ADurb.Bin182]
MKILSYIVIIAGLGILISTGSPRRWGKGTCPKNILIDAGGALAALAGLWLLNK